eukprot:symbB.v1.2.002766.t1/scaffold141.1/size300911/17
MHAPPAPAPQLAPVDEDREIPKRQRMWLTDGEFMPFYMSRRRPEPLASLAQPSQIRDSSWPQLAFDPEAALEEDRGERRCDSVDAYAVLAGDSNALTMWNATLPEDTARSSSVMQPSEALPSPFATLPLEAIHFVDSAQGLSHVLTFFQQAAPAYIGIDLEWSDPQPVSIIQIATPSRAFVLDCVNRTPLYMSVLHYLMDYLLKREATTKLFFGFPHDLVRLNMLFGPFGRTFGSQDYIASVLDLYMQRVRRVQVRKPRKEDTPFGREMLMGEALKAENLEEIARVGKEPLPPYPIEEIGFEDEYSEQAFTVGGHQSLSRLVNTYLGETMNKQYRVSNWNFRPLSTVQVIYAATDAHVLLRLEAALRKEQVLPQRTWGVAYRDSKQPAWWRTADSPECAIFNIDILKNHIQPHVLTLVMKRTAEGLEKDVSNGKDDSANESNGSATSLNSVDFWRCQIEAVYTRRNPHKLGNVQALLEKYSGREAILYRKVCETYQLDPSKFYTDPKAWEQYETDVQADESAADETPAGDAASSSDATGSGVSVPSLFGISSFDQPQPRQSGSDSDTENVDSTKPPAPKEGECKTQ